MKENDCPMENCFLSKTGGCQPEYRAECEYQERMMRERELRQQEALQSLIDQAQELNLGY